MVECVRVFLHASCCFGKKYRPEWWHSSCLWRFYTAVRTFIFFFQLVYHVCYGVWSGVDSSVCVRERVCASWMNSSWTRVHLMFLFSLSAAAVAAPGVLSLSLLYATLLVAFLKGRVVTSPQPLACICWRQVSAPSLSQVNGSTPPIYIYIYSVIGESGFYGIKGKPVVCSVK